jgi:hypothetical protein
VGPTEIALALFVPGAAGLAFVAKDDRELFFKIVGPTSMLALALSVFALWQTFMLAVIAEQIEPYIEPSKRSAVGKLLSQWLVPDTVTSFIFAFDAVVVVCLVVAVHYDRKGRSG